MRQIVFIGSHLGYPMDETPLGGGAMVGLQLARHWRGDRRARFHLLGSGPECPAPDMEYARFARGAEKGLTGLSELEYARFCRAFEAATTDWVLRRGFDPAKTCVLVNDVSEGPTLVRLSQAGFPILSLWHVDVVDYFNRLYLKEWLPTHSVTRAYEKLARAMGQGLLPDLLKLVFDKQRETVRRSDRMIFPSTAMAETIRRCYEPDDFAARALVVPWGTWQEPGDASAAAGLRNHYQLTPETTVLMTLSRISPEKGVHLLLEALKLLEERNVLPRDTCLFICGQAAFMQGEAYLQRVRRAAARLKKVRVFFPGYLGQAEKPAYYALADLFISPSIHDSYGLNIVEAMRAGLPILASDHYGVQDVVKDEFGVKVRYLSLKAAPRLLAERLTPLLADKARLGAMGRAARRAAEEMPFSRAAERVLSTALELAREPAAAAAK